MFALNVLSEEGPNTELAGLLWWVLGFFLLMIVIGWWQSTKNKPAESPIHASHPQDDNLEIIEGIGPKVAKVLEAAGDLV